jgi:hypothetical protein
MSVQALAWVFDHFTGWCEARGMDPSAGQRLVLLSIANHADKEGRNAWPSTATICGEAAVSKRTAETAIRWLEDGGVILREVNRGGLPETPSDRRPNRYSILAMTPPSGSAIPSDPAEGAGRQSVQERVGNSCADGSATIADQTVLEPSKGTTTRRTAHADDVDAIFEAWREATDHPRAKLDKARRAKIEARLKDGYSRDELIVAVRGIARSEFHMGENDRHQRYDDITIALRDAAHVEKFANLELQGRRRSANLGGRETWMDRGTTLAELEARG